MKVYNMYNIYEYIIYVVYIYYIMIHRYNYENNVPSRLTPQHVYIHIKDIMMYKDTSDIHRS